MFNIKINKKAQIGQTMTWVVATVIIMIILIISIVITADPRIKTLKALPYTNKVDLFADKSLTAYLLTNKSAGARVYATLANENDVNDFNKNLAQMIFINLYSGYYDYLSFELNPGTKTIAFFAYGGGNLPTDFTVKNIINIGNKKFVQLEMTHKT